MNKNSFLKIQLKKIQSQLISSDGKYSITIKINLEETPLLKDQTYFSTEREILMNQNFIFTLSNQKIKRNSICIIEIWDADSLQLFGEVSFMIMDYKNYTKKIFPVIKCKDQNAILLMNTNISFTRPSQNKETKIKLPQKEMQNGLITPVKLKLDIKESSPVNNNLSLPIQMAQMILDKPESNIRISSSITDNLQSNIKMSESIADHLHLPISEVKIEVSNDDQKQDKSSLSIFEKSGVVIKSKFEIQKQEKPEKQEMNQQKLLNLRVDPSTNIKNNFLKIPDGKNLASSCRLTGSRNADDSHYCKDIQQNLNNLSNLQNQTSRLSKTRSPLKNEENEIQIMDTLRKMKSKFERIHEKEAILNNDEELDQLIAQNQKSENTNGKQSFNQLRKSIHPILNEQSQNCIGRPQNSFINSFTNSKYLYLNQTVNIMIQPKNIKMRKKMRTQRTINIKYQKVSSKLQTNIQRQENKQIREGNEGKDEPQSSYMRKTYKKFDLEEEQLQKMNYIKLNEMSYLSEAANISRRRNTFLILANDQLFAAQQRLDQKLQISKNIIAQKQDVLTNQFQQLQQQICTISLKLSQTNKQAQIREEKIMSLQSQLQIYSRQNNTLKIEMKSQSKNMQQLRCVLAMTQRKITEQDNINPPATSIKTILEKQVPPRTARSLYQKGQDKQKTSNIFTVQKKSNSSSKPVTEKQFKVNRQHSTSNRVNPLQIDDVRGKSALFQRFRHGKSESFCFDSANKTDKYLVNKLVQYTPKDLTKRNR